MLLPQRSRASRLPLRQHQLACNRVQGATASLAFTATAAPWNLQLTESTGSWWVRIHPLRQLRSLALARWRLAWSSGAPQRAFGALRAGTNPTLSANPLAFGSVVGTSGGLQASRDALRASRFGTNPQPSLALATRASYVKSQDNGDTSGSLLLAGNRVESDDERRADPVSDLAVEGAAASRRKLANCGANLPTFRHFPPGLPTNGRSGTRHTARPVRATRPAHRIGRPDPRRGSGWRSRRPR